MTPRDLKSILRGAGLDMVTSHDAVRVLVELKSDEPGVDCLARLSKLGLDTQRVLGKTILGSIQRGRIPALSDDPAVAAVELSVPLKPKDL
jgi:hypothetical protein